MLLDYVVNSPFRGNVLILYYISGVIEMDIQKDTLKFLYQKTGF